MASFSVVNITSTSAYIRIVPDSDYLYYRVFVRLADDISNQTFNAVYELSSTDSKKVANLSPETEYAVNVGYNNGGNIWTWIASPAPTFTTLADDDSGNTTAAGVVKVYVDGEWVNAVPHVYADGEWKIANPHIYSNGWKVTKEG